ncbi:MAG TPA: hypothetical protein VNE62_06700, partial [Actinomycetota bacterium]|nr:hypothetical protein [Actinomycetota bacterium]
VVVFTQTSVDLPEGVKNPRNGQDNLANPTLDSRGFGCTLSPDFEANTSFIYPGSTIIASRNLAGAASTYCFDGSLMGFRCGGVVVYSDIVNGNAYESEELALDPTALGCTLAFFDGSRGAGSEYCTLTHLQP